ncbi:hypothetical protein D9M72_453620 [compost metagenome]
MGGLAGSQPLDADRKRAGAGDLVVAEGDHLPGPGDGRKDCLKGGRFGVEDNYGIELLLSRQQAGHEVGAHRPHRHQHGDQGRRLRRQSGKGNPAVLQEAPEQVRLPRVLGNACTPPFGQRPPQPCRAAGDVGVVSQAVFGFELAQGVAVGHRQVVVPADHRFKG